MLQMEREVLWECAQEGSVSVQQAESSSIWEGFSELNQTDNEKSTCCLPVHTDI